MQNLRVYRKGDSLEFPLPSGAKASRGGFIALVNGEHEVSYRIVDDSMVVITEDVPDGATIALRWDVPEDAPVKFIPSAASFTPKILNRTIEWLKGLVREVREAVQQTCMRISGSKGSAASWDAAGLPLANIGMPVDDSCACPVGLAKAMAADAGSGIQKDIDALASAVSNDLALVKRTLHEFGKSSKRVSGDIRSDVEGLQDYIRKTEKDIRSELLSVERGLARRLVKYEAQLKELIEKPKPKAAASSDDIEGLAFAVSKELEAMNKRLLAVEEPQPIPIEELAMEMAEELNALGLRLAALENKKGDNDV